MFFIKIKDNEKELYYKEDIGSNLITCAKAIEVPFYHCHNSANAIADYLKNKFGVNARVEEKSIEQLYNE